MSYKNRAQLQAEITELSNETAEKSITNARDAAWRQNQMDSGVNGYMWYDTITASIKSIAKIFDLVFKTGLATPTHEEGKFYYDNVNKCHSAMNDIAGSSMQLGRENWERSLNDSGALIPNGSVVYVSGASSGNPTIALAKADNITSSSVLGVATHDIANGEQGEVTPFGRVNDVNTNGWAVGTQLYLSAATAGALTPTPPLIPNYVIPICKVYAMGTTDGILGVNIGQIVYPQENNKGWSYSSYRNLGSELNWVGGFYTSMASFTPDSGGDTLGDTESMHLAHVIIVLGAASTNMVVRVTGKRYDLETGTLTTGYTSDIDTSGGAINDFYETPEHFVGEVTYTLLSGTGVVVNGGLVSYWDNNNNRYLLTNIQWDGLCGANDTVDLELYHKKDSAFTYNSAGAIFTPILKMSDELGVNRKVVNGEPFRYKRGLNNIVVSGDSDEGIILKISVTSTDAVRYSDVDIHFLDRHLD